MAERAEPTVSGGSSPTTPLHKVDWWVRDVSFSCAREIVTRLHYSKGGSNTAVYAHGLFRRDKTVFEADCLGVAWWIPPTRSCAEASHDGDWRKVLSLSRLVIAPEVPPNAASFVLSHSIRKIRQSGLWELGITYADTWRGHIGKIYLAAGWTYVGMTTPQATWIDGNGRMVAKKAGPKTRTRADMEALGYTCVGKFAKHKYKIRL